MNAQEKISALRAQITSHQLDGFIIPRGDEYGGEFVAPYAERLKWLTGFSGSAGFAIVLKDRAAVFSDGRYTIQLRQQIDLVLYEAVNSVEISAADWLCKNVHAGVKIGFDPWLHTPSNIAALSEKFLALSIDLIPVSDNLVDKIWDDQPQKPIGKAGLFPVSIAGYSAQDKKAMIAQALGSVKAFACVLTAPDSIAWLLNVRGCDVAYLPVVLSYAVVFADNRPVLWVVDSRKIQGAVRESIVGIADIIPPSDFEHYLQEIIFEAKAKSLPVVLDFSSAPQRIKTLIESAGGAVLDMKDPCSRPRAIKTPQEQASIRKAHIKDGAALVKFICWLEEAIAKGAILTEIHIEEQLETFRRQDSTYRGPSFATIAGVGSNGAIVHYRAQASTNKALEAGNLLLLDSGGQYEWGTTDITRTLAIGAPSQEMKVHYTRVLQGHIAVARAQFKAGTLGAQIDALARAPLQKHGLDYAHGTGHGVGCYLSVHEEAANISPRGKASLEAGMLLSNEPGYYQEGAYGIRSENLVLVQNIKDDLLGFETLSLVPFDLRLIEQSLLQPEECEWLNAYHQRVFLELVPLLDTKTRSWLEKKTRALPQ